MSARKRKNSSERTVEKMPAYRNIEERISEKFQINYETGCWEWTGALDIGGYGQISVDNRCKLAHRISWNVFKGAIPNGLQIDHLCRNRKCVNPDHLRVTTRKDNILCSNGITARQVRQTHCKRGHEFTKENTYIDTKEGRNCIECKRMLQRRWGAKNKEKVKLWNRRYTLRGVK